jgi:hypothetical protein
MGLFSGLGALFAALILLPIPSWLGGEDTVRNIHIMYLCTTGIVAATGVLVWVRADRERKSVCVCV